MIVGIKYADESGKYVGFGLSSVATISGFGLLRR